MDKHFALYLVFFTCYAGLLALSLAMDRHHAQVLRGKPGRSRRLALRLAGWGLLGLALWLCSLAWGWAIGPVAWFGLLSAAAFGLVFLLPYAPRFVPWLTVIGPLLALPPFFF
ncbi:DUF3325 domain-containing protein [Rhodocyclus tenuis]|uniref:DUF3325 domain-containing protein n=1 Tax=Rhodocyclus tenuis TaxID=1066 RepID=UPI0019035156|nr:DUF3325 domain-containing protein [Rhodocyclus tenuis]MBK1680952.1 hypothetical protein [Rhodocyclus tenuis]